jgi:hypothetical protein
MSRLVLLAQILLTTDGSLYYAAIMVGAMPGQCLVVATPLKIRSFMPCGEVVSFIRDKVHAPIGGSLMVIWRGDENMAKWKELNGQLADAGFKPTL